VGLQLTGDAFCVQSSHQGGSSLWEKQESRGRGDPGVGGAGPGPGGSGAAQSIASGGVSQGGPSGPNVSAGARLAERTPLLGGDHSASNLPSMMPHYTKGNLNSMNSTFRFDTANFRWKVIRFY